MRLTRCFLFWKIGLKYFLIPVVKIAENSNAIIVSLTTGRTSSYLFLVAFYNNPPPVSMSGDFISFFIRRERKTALLMILSLTSLVSFPEQRQLQLEWTDYFIIRVCNGYWIQLVGLIL